MILIRTLLVKSVRLLICGCLFFLSGCHSVDRIEPSISYELPSRCLSQLPSSFLPLTEEELEQDWGKEFHIGLQFAKEADYYRAITSFKRALILIPECFCERRLQLQFLIMQCYYLGNKYEEAVEIYEHSNLGELSVNFPGLKDLLVMLEDSYYRLDRPRAAEKIRRFLCAHDFSLLESLDISHAFVSGDLPYLNEVSHDHALVRRFLNDYGACAKSPRHAQVLNAIFPGAGYFYAGQYKAAITSLVINSLFTYAAYQFFDHHYYAAGVITASLEAGWYFGGINGAGLAIKEYNERLYDTCARDFLIQQKLFPVLMFQYVF